MIDLDYVKDHFNPTDPQLAGEGPLLGDGLWEAVDLMLASCPVVHSDGTWYGMPEGGWLVNRYRDVMKVLKDSERFSSLGKKGTEDEPDLPPFDSDPPLHGEFRRLLQPFFNKQRIHDSEPVARGIITQLIDRFAETGRCDDAISQLTYPFSQEVKWAWNHETLGVEVNERDQVQEWVEIWLHKHFEPEFEEACSALLAWISETVERRKSEPRRNDIIDALVYGQVAGRPLTNEEVMGVVVIMLHGGTTATGGAIANILLRLAAYPELQQRLRAVDGSRLPNAIEELLRIEPPVSGIARRCTRDTELGGQKIKAGERVFYHVPAANRDPEQFPNPHEIDFDRTPNRQLAFGDGRHRCLGDNVARTNIRIAIEEILARMDSIQLIESDPPKRTGGAVEWHVEHLPLTFTPSPRRDAPPMGE